MRQRFFAFYLWFMYCVYILLCADNSLYTGITNNLEKRVQCHNRGNGAKYTRSRRPVTVVYTEPAADKSAALRREYEIKAMTRFQKILLISSANPLPPIE